jgi:hypothetical protein
MAEETRCTIGDDSKVFGMTRNDVAEALNALAQQKDQNHPTNMGSYADFAKTVRKGREALCHQNGYCKTKP